ncbi:TetR/AcrR family transcriptional regulator [Klenkia brasiliensis]|uniref:Transcriptional regulator, TetR family n=1 Tax=Klenkia brasiliensis TaxID=333142 RepID=A0A1G7UB67_9ACTN|nr:TetR/AcrR family transcriptional regulator [Klenkia brasiliensis]SDG44733.1 transcriptional regulator, TetR family [Klenkia brasiliensis]
MSSSTLQETALPNRGGRPRDPSRDCAIRAAILRLLGEVGYNALTMDAVAAEAGVGKATIYRRWRTKSDLVVDTITGMDGSTEVPDTGDLAGDLRALLRSLVDRLNGPTGSASLSLLSTLPHQPELAEAFRTGPLAGWRRALTTVWERAEARGEVREGTGRTAVAQAASALLVQRWLITREPLDDDYVDTVLETVVLPLARSTAPA